jgi:hypothetical protein
MPDRAQVEPARLPTRRGAVSGPPTRSTRGSCRGRGRFVSRLPAPDRRRSLVTCVDNLIACRRTCGPVRQRQFTRQPDVPPAGTLPGSSRPVLHSRLNESRRRSTRSDAAVNSAGTAAAGSEITATSSCTCQRRKRTGIARPSTAGTYWKPIPSAAVAMTRSAGRPRRAGAEPGVPAAIVRVFARTAGVRLDDGRVVPEFWPPPSRGARCRSGRSAGRARTLYIDDLVDGLLDVAVDPERQTDPQHREPGRRSPLELASRVLSVSGSSSAPRGRAAR